MLFIIAFLALAGICLASPFLEETTDGNWNFGNDVWNATQKKSTRTDKLWYMNKELVGRSVGHYYSSSIAGNNFSVTSAHKAYEGELDGVPYLDFYFESQAGEQHWVIFEGHHGAYQYFIATGMSNPGEFRSLWRLDNRTFTHGHTSVHDSILPSLEDHQTGEFVFDSTYRRPDGTYITKYDFANFIHNFDYYGVYGEGFGSWYMHAGKDYFNGDHLRQELVVHREVNTGDVVQLNMLHGVHFFSPRNVTLLENKLYGPWLWYLNNGSSTDAAEKATQEKAKWPYSWPENASYHSRGVLKGRLVLSDGRPASRAAVFLGDDSAALSTLRQGRAYYYSFYADDDGNFEVENVRSGSYRLIAWSNGSSIADVGTNYTTYGVKIGADETTDLGSLNWEVSNRTTIFRLGDFDRTTYGFKFGGAPREYGLTEPCPADLVYEIGKSTPTDWCYAQTKKGNWTIKFPIQEQSSAKEAKLILSLAAYSQGGNFHILVNDHHIATVNSSTLSNDGALYRSCTVAGEWRYLEYVVNVSVLRVSHTNTVTIWLYENTGNNSETMRTTQRGPMYDAMMLEW